METLTRTLVRAARTGFPAELDELNRELAALGWSPIGSVAPPHSKQWEVGGIRLLLSKVEGQWFADVIFREVIPDGFVERGSEALEDASAELLPFYREKRDEVLAALTPQVEVIQTEELSFEDCSFAEWSEWRFDGLPFVLGISVVDIDLPVLLMARTRLAIDQS
ncbi:hypothetical protein ACWD5V_42505 [Streptomyces sp. NPDC002523]